MSNKLHRDLTGDELHLPKGFEEASNETALVKNSDGDLEYRALNVLGETGPVGPQGPDASAIQNVVVVQKSPGPDQYSDPIVAMAAITGNTANNPFVMRVGPGVYSLSAPLVVKPHVTVIADGRATPIFEPADPDNDIVQISSESARIHGLLLRNATGPAAAGLRVTDTGSVAAVLDYLNIENCTEHIVVEGTAAHVQIAILHFRMVSGAATKRFINILAAGGFTAVLRAYTTLITESSGAVFEDGVLISGAGARFDANVLLLRSTTGFGYGVRMLDGAEFSAQAGGEISGFDKNIFVENVGAAPVIRTTTFTLLDGVDKDIDIEHPDTEGSAIFKANLDKVTVNDDAPIKILLNPTDPADPTGLFIRGDFQQADTFSHRINLSKLSRGTATMGLYSGGMLSDAGGLNVNVGSGNGFLLDSDGVVREVSWDADVVTLLPQTATYIYVNQNGLISSGTALPDVTENIVLGLVGTLAGSVHYIQESAVDMKQIGNDIELFNRSALGAIYESGSIIAEGSSARTLDVGGGRYWFGTGVFNPVGGTPITFSQFFRQAVSGFNVITGVTVVSNTHYDTGTGALVPITSGKFVKHSLYVTVSEGATLYMLVTSQAEYDTLVEAEAADVPTPPTTFKNAVVLIGTVVVQEGVDPVSTISDVRPVVGFKAPGVSAVATHSNLLGLDADDHLQYLRTDGGRTMTGNLNMGGNNVLNPGLVDGVDVSNHASRHLPSGADPLTIGTPATIGAVNDAGNSNDYSRGNHSHAHGNLGGGSTHAAATTLVNGYMSAADKVRVDAIETIADGRITLQKAQPSGLASLDSGGKVPAAQLPSYVDDVEEYANLAAFPVTGETGKIYVALNTNKTYRWSGSVYVEISPSEVNSVNGFTGIVTLLTTHIAEGTNLYFTNARARLALSATAPVAYDNTTGVISMPAAVGGDTPSDGYMLGTDKKKVDRLQTAFLQYTNNTQYTRTTATFTDVILDTDLSSFANSMLTKLSTTEFRTDFAGRIRVHYSVNGAAAGNNRGYKAQVVKNGTLVTNTHRHAASSSTVSQSQIGHTQIIECAVNDVFKLQTASEDANTTTFAANESSLLVEVYSIGLT